MQRVLLRSLETHTFFGAPTRSLSSDSDPVSTKAEKSTSNNPHTDLFTRPSHQPAGMNNLAGQVSRAVPEWCMCQDRLNRRRRAQATAPRHLTAHLFALALGLEQKASLIPISWRRTRVRFPIHVSLLGTCSTPAHRSQQLAPVAIC